MSSYKHSIEVSVDKVITETQKNQLMLSLEKALTEVLGESESGTVRICSEKESSENKT